MRILYLNHNVAGSGTYQRALHIAREAVRRGHDAVLVATSRTRMVRGERRTIDGVRVVEAPDLLRGPARNGWDAWNTAWRSSRIVRERFDLVHAFDARPVVIVPALAARATTRAPLVLDWADWWGRGGVIGERSGWAVRTFFGPIETWFEEAFRTGATANTVISERLRERCIRLGVPDDRVHVMPNGCNPARPVSDTERARAREALGLEPGTPLLVHVGAMHQADAALLCAAFRIVRQRLPDARLAFVGNTRVRASALAGGGVSSAGFVATGVLREWLAAADAGAVVLRDNIASHARWPGKINDYLTAGVPVVMPHIGAAADYVSRYGAGRTASPDPDSFAQAILDVLRDRDLRANASASALALADGPLSWPHVTDPLFDFYARWCSPQAKPAAAGNMVSAA
ncbi:MAG TPA: glycosyltransferase [Longimicrobiales bacterium]